MPTEELQKISSLLDNLAGYLIDSENNLQRFIEVYQQQQISKLKAINRFDVNLFNNFDCFTPQLDVTSSSIITTIKESLESIQEKYDISKREHQTAIEAHTTNIDSLNTRIHELTEELNKANTKIEALNNELRDAYIEVDASEEERDEVLKKLKECQAKVKLVVNIKETKEYKDLQKQLTICNNNLTRERENYKELEKENTSHQNLANLYKQEATGLKAEIARLKPLDDRNRLLEDENKNYEEKHGQAIDLLTQYKDSYNYLYECMDSLGPSIITIAKGGRGTVRELTIMMQKMNRNEPGLTDFGVWFKDNLCGTIMVNLFSVFTMYGKDYKPLNADFIGTDATKKTADGIFNIEAKCLTSKKIDILSPLDKYFNYFAKKHKNEQIELLNSLNAPTKEIYEPLDFISLAQILPMAAKSYLNSFGGLPIYNKTNPIPNYPNYNPVMKIVNSNINIIKELNKCKKIGSIGELSDGILTNLIARKEVTDSIRNNLVLGDIRDPKELEDLYDETTKE